METNLIIESVEDAGNLFNKQYNAFITAQPRTVTIEDDTFTLYSFEKMIALTNIEGKKWSMLMLSSSITIGNNASGDLLFIDRHDSKTLYIFRHDDGSLFKTKWTLSKLIKAYSE